MIKIGDKEISIQELDNIINNYDFVSELDEVIISSVGKDYEEEGYEDAYEYYVDFGRGEAESEMLDDFFKKELNISSNNAHSVEFELDGEKYNLFNYLKEHLLTENIDLD